MKRMQQRGTSFKRYGRFQALTSKPVPDDYFDKQAERIGRELHDFYMASVGPKFFQEAKDWGEDNERD